MDRCNAEYSVGDFADLTCVNIKGHKSMLHDNGTIFWSNHCNHEMISNYPDGKHSYCGKCYTSNSNI